MRFVSLVAFVVSLIGIMPASALVVRGPGNKSCAVWAADHKTDGIAGSAEDIWLTGYITAYSRWAHRDGDIGLGLDNGALSAYVTQYCSTHPLDTVEVAAEDLIVQLIAMESAKALGLDRR